MNYEPHVFRDQFEFQRAFVQGHILNVGCNTDGARLKSDFGAINLDLRDVDHVTGERLPVDVLGDARALPWRETFDSVVLGELLEHMERSDALAALVCAGLALKPGGRVVVTIPHDDRRESGTLELPEPEKQFYAPGVYAYHYRAISRREIVQWIVDSGLKVLTLAKILYPWGCEGSGIVALRPEVASC